MDAAAHLVFAGAETSRVLLPPFAITLLALCRLAEYTVLSLVQTPITVPVEQFEHLLDKCAASPAE